MLPHEQLKPLYDKVVWLWVFRDFKDSDMEKDAARTMDRYGLTMYPYLLFINPNDHKILTVSGRSIEAVLKAAGDAGKKMPKPDDSLAALDKKMKAAKKALSGLADQRMNTMKTMLDNL